MNRRIPASGVLLFAVAALTAPPVLAFEGTVVLADGSPIEGASVSVPGRPDAARTGPGGRFVLEPDPHPPFTLLVVLATGQAMQPVVIAALPAAGPLLVRVEPMLREAATVVDEPAPALHAPPAGALTRVAGDEIAERHATRLTDALATVPGTGRLEEGHAAVPSIRGLARGRTVILIDGQRVTTERRAGPSASFLDPFFLESLEVLRGAGPPAHGPDAMGGVIEARSHEPAPGEPLRARAYLGGGAGLPERSAAVEVSRGFADGAFLFRGRWRAFDDYRSPAGEVANSAAEDRGFQARGSGRIGPGRAALGWQSDAGRDIGKPAESAAVSSYPDEDSHRFTASYDLDPRGEWSGVAVTGFLGRYALVTARDEPAGATTGARAVRSDVVARDFSLRAAARRSAGAGRLDLGAEVRGRDGLEAENRIEEFDPAGNLTAATGERAIEDARQIDGGVHVGGEAPLAPWLRAAGGVRFDRITTRNRGGTFGDRSTAHGAVTGHAALVLGPFRDLSVTVQVARAFRDPTLSDRYYAGVSGRGYVTGNPDLDPERSLQLDLAVRLENGPVRAALYVYEYRIDGFVERYEAAPDQFTFRNLDGARLRGAEVEVRATLRRGTTLQAGLQVARGEDRDGGAALDDVPPRAALLMLRREIGRRGHLLLRAAAYARDDDPGPTEAVTPGYATIDLGGGFALGKGGEVRVLVGNVLDHVHPASHDARAPLAPGRTGSIGLVWTF